MKCLLGLLSSFEISDGVITHFLVSSGLAREGNPLMAPLVGNVSFLVLKVVGVLLCVFLLWRLYKRFRRATMIVTITVVVFYGLLLAWNLGLFVAGLSLI